MSELGKWQIISFLSRGGAMLFGLIQSFVIIRVLTLGEWGTVQLAVSVGAALGIYQHLGLASASTREISSVKNQKEIFKIFVTASFVRYCITLPIAVGLFFFSKHIAINWYKNDVLILPLQIYAVTLLFQAVQSLLNSVISGTKRFKQLFTYQVAIAFVSVLLYVPLVYFFRINGYFYAFFLFNVIASITLGFVAFGPLKDKLMFPSKKDFAKWFKEIFSISIAIYLVKIIYTNWEKLGNNALGIFNSPETIAIYAFALLYAKKLMNISDAVTDVNLPVLSEKFVKDIKEFKKVFSKNFSKVFSLVILAAAFASYWAPNIIRFLVGGTKYDEALVLIPPMILAFIIYSFINIFKSSVLIPAKLVKEMFLSFVFMLVGTVGFFFFTFKLMDPLIAMAWGMAFGAFLSFLAMSLFIKNKLKHTFINIDHAAIILQAFFISWLCTVDVLWVKAISFLPLYALLIWALFIAGFFTKSDANALYKKVKGFVKK